MSKRGVKMLNRKNRKLGLKCIKLYTGRENMISLNEECAELSKEVCKALRGGVRAGKLKEELVDVIVMAERLRMIINVSDKEINKMAARKLKRAIRERKRHKL